MASGRRDANDSGSTWRPFRKKLQCSFCHINQRNASRAVAWRQLSSQYLPCILITTPPGGESAPCQAGSEGRAEMPAPGPWGWAEGQQPRPNALPQDKHRRRLSLSPGKRGLQILEKSSQRQTPGLIPWSRSYLSPPEGTLAADPWTGSDKSKQGLAGRHFENNKT